MIFLLFFVLGAVIGVAGTYAYLDAWRIWMRDEADRWETARMQEMKDLRAQLALHIGNTPVEVLRERKAAHSACQIKRAECPQPPIS